jgi:putative aminopeptidase FrvX
MDKALEFIIDKVKRYSMVPSLTYHEMEFLEHLSADIPETNYALSRGNKYLLYKHINQKAHSKFLVLAHTDRIRVATPVNFIVENEQYFHGQLDNVISVAICRWLMEQNMPVDFMFTTQEETCNNADMISEVCKLHPNYLCLDMDVDVTVKGDDWPDVECGAITLRDRDNNAVYDKKLVEKIRGIAEVSGVYYIEKNGHWLVDEIGIAMQEDHRIKGMYLGIMIANYHSNVEITNFKCVQNMLKLFDGIRKEISK